MAEGEAYPAVTLCFGPTKGIVFIITVIPDAAAGTELAFTWREDSGTLCRGAQHPSPGAGESPPHRTLLLLWVEAVHARNTSLC